MFFSLQTDMVTKRKRLTEPFCIYFANSEKFITKTESMSCLNETLAERLIQLKNAAKCSFRSTMSPLHS